MPGALLRGRHNCRIGLRVLRDGRKDMLAGRQQEIHAERDRKLEAARKQRPIRRKPLA